VKLALAQIGLAIDFSGLAIVAMLIFTSFACVLPAAAGICLFPDLKRYRTAIILGGLGLLAHSGIVIVCIIDLGLNWMILVPVACVLIDATAIYAGVQGFLREPPSTQ
jgi:hypothetical protein